MKTKEVQRLISEDPDWVNLKRFDYSLEKVLDRFPDGAPTHTIAAALMISEEEVDEIAKTAIIKIRQALGVEVEDEED